MNDLLENLKRFIDAGDESRYYQLTRDEVRLLVGEIEKLRGSQIQVLTFEDIRAQARARREERVKRHQNG